MENNFVVIKFSKLIELEINEMRNIKLINMEQIAELIT